MLPFETSVSIFWQESSTYVAVYATYALLVSAVVGGLELRSQASPASRTKLLFKAVALAAASTAACTVWMFATSWYSRVLGGEVVTAVVLGAAWYAALYFLNASLLEASAAVFARPRLQAHLPVVVLMLPCLLGFAFLFALGSAWHI